MRSAARDLVLIGFVLALAACSSSRALVRPQTVEGTPDHIYFVEQNNGKSNIVKCDVLPDNHVRCTRQHTLD
jgi:hypothetical protein